MGTFTNSEDPDDILHKSHIMLYSIWVYTVRKCKKIFSQMNAIFSENYNLTSLTIYTMDHPKVIVSNQTEEPISIQMVKLVLVGNRVVAIPFILIH